MHNPVLLDGLNFQVAGMAVVEIADERAIEDWYNALVRSSEITKMHSEWVHYLGGEGWELVSVVDERMYFKRKVK